MKRTILLIVGTTCLNLGWFAFSGFAQQPAQKTGQQESDSDRYKPHSGGLVPQPPTQEGTLPAGRVMDLKKQALLLFREDWKNGVGVTSISSAKPMSPTQISSFKVYGDKSTYLAVDTSPESTGVILFSGICRSTCAVALRDKNAYMDLSGLRPDPLAHAPVGVPHFSPDREARRRDVADR